MERRTQGLDLNLSRGLQGEWLSNVKKGTDICLYSRLGEVPSQLWGLHREAW